MAERRERSRPRVRPLSGRWGGLSHFIATACILRPAAAAADEWPKAIPQTRLLLSSTFGANYDSEGFEEQVRLGAQMLLYRSQNPVFRDNFLFVGVSPRINPVNMRGGPSIEIQPLTVFNLRMTLDFCDYFAAF